MQIFVEVDEKRRHLGQSLQHIDDEFTERSNSVIFYCHYQCKKYPR